MTHSPDRLPVADSARNSAADQIDPQRPGTTSCASPTHPIASELQASTLTTTWTTARARLPARTFKAEHNTYNYHHGMHAKVEVKIQSKPFLATLLPGLQKYLPE